MICGIWTLDPYEGGWCLICNQGGFDAVVLQSDNKKLLELNKPYLQPLYDRLLTIKPLVEVRTPKLDYEDFIIPVGGPGDNAG